MTRRWAVWPAAAAVILLAVAGCQAKPAASPSSRSTTAATCPELAARIVDALQDYVDSFADTSAADIGEAVSARQREFGQATTALRERGEELGCKPAELADLVRRELGRLTGGTPVQDAVADTFRSDPLGTIDPSDSAASEIVVNSTAQLRSVLATAGSGSTIRIAKGTYALTTPLVALRPVTLIGAGDGSDPGSGVTTLTSRAAGATLVAATGGNLALTDLAIEHAGGQSASVVVVAGGGYRFERVRVSGGVAQDGTGGYGIVLRPASSPLTPTGDSRVLTDVTLTGNEGGGLVIAGAEEPTITGARVIDTAGCGLCWVESAGGTASDSTVTRAKIGLRVDNSAAPVIRTFRIDGAPVGVALTGTGSPAVRGSTIIDADIGIQLTGSGSPVLAGNRVVGATEIGIRLSGTARATLEGNQVSGRTKVAVATVADAASTITGGQVTNTGDVGLIWGERATGSATSVVVRGPELGVQIAGEAAVTLTDVTVDRSDAAAVLASDRSSGTLTRLTCGTGSRAAVVLADKTKVELVDSPTCTPYRR